MLTVKYPCLKSKTVFITGGATGIGASLVFEFANQSANVGFVDIRDKPSMALVEQLGPNVNFKNWDIPELRKSIRTFEGLWNSPIDILVNNAGRDTRHSFSALEPEDWDEAINVNLRHQFFGAQAVIPGMIKNGGGSVINLGSTVVAMAAGNMAAYVTAKAGVQGMTRALVRDVGMDTLL